MELKELRSVRPVRLYSAWPGIVSWVGYYRLLKPLAWGDYFGLCQSAIDRGPDKEVDLDTRTAIMLAADAIWLHQATGDAFENLAGLAERGAFIYGADDDLDNMDPLNPAYVHTGTTDGLGRLLDPGEPVCMTHNGEERVLWEDRVTMSEGRLFDIARNRAAREQRHRIARRADGIITSTHELAHVFRSIGCDNIYVYPNSLDPEDYPEIQLAPHKNVRILWTGGASHLPDLYTIAAPLGRVLNRHPEVEFVVWGQTFEALTSWTGGRATYIPWLAPEAYTLRLATIGHDINLCPLRPTMFAASKSAIKWYESSAITHPAATLATRFGPFHEIQDNETGMLFSTPDEFETKLEALILDATLRQRLASNARDWVWTHRDIRKNVGPLYEWMQQTIDARPPRGRRIEVARTLPKRPTVRI